MRIAFRRFAVLSATLLFAHSVFAQNVLPGWDLFETAPGTTSGGLFFTPNVPFVGVPLGNYDFGGTIGLKPVGDTDTIIQRLQTANAPGPFPAINIQMVALQLQSAIPFDPDGPGGAPVATYYITLQSARGGPGSFGTMNITFNGSPVDPRGTFDSSVNVAYDLRMGALNGPIVTSGLLPLNSAGTAWGRTASPGSLTIPGVNYLLNGVNTDSDFWPVGLVENHPSGAQHIVTPTPVPFHFSPALGLVLSGVFVGLGQLRRKFKASKA